MARRRARSCIIWHCPGLFGNANDVCRLDANADLTAGSRILDLRGCWICEDVDQQGHIELYRFKGMQFGSRYSWESDQKERRAPPWGLLARQHSE